MENVENVANASNEVEVKGTGKGLMIAAAVGAVILVGGFVYKKVIAPAIAKRKAQKEAKAEASEAEQATSDKT